MDRDLLAEGARNLRDYLQSQGYFDAEVQFKEQRVINDQANIDYLINTGGRAPAGGHRNRGQSLLHHRRHPRAHVLAGAQAAAIPARPLQRKPAAPRRRFHLEPLPVQRLSRRQGHAPRGGQLPRQGRRPGRLPRTSTKGRNTSSPTCRWMASSTWTAPRSPRGSAPWPASRSANSTWPWTATPSWRSTSTKGFANATFEWSSSPPPSRTSVDLRYDHPRRPASSSCAR